MHEIVLVTVTYGARWHLLAKSLASAFSEGVDHAVVVDNAADPPAGKLAKEMFGDRVSVVSLLANTGSANGYSVGLKAAYGLGAAFIVLLDDDNIFDSGALSKLRSAYAVAERSTPRDRLAVVGMRPEHQFDVLRGLDGKRLNPRRDSFFGFHVVDIPDKIRRSVLRPGLRDQQKELPGLVRLDVVPYGGMLFHRELLDRQGYPDTRLILYGDDTEFSYRITSSGGANLLVTGAMLSDLESSWSVRTDNASSFRMWLCGQGDFRAYYSCRNGAYFERHVRSHRVWMRKINKTAYLFLLRMESIRLGKQSRYRLLCRAIADGESGRLGMSPEYLLQ